MDEFTLDIFGRLHLSSKISALESRSKVEQCISQILKDKSLSFSLYYDYDVVVFRIESVCLRFRTNTSFKKSGNAALYSSFTTFFTYEIGNDPIKTINQGFFSDKLKIPVRSIVKKFIKKAKSQ
jgi:uncharacterized protein involved in outer membrane biogenesis